MLALDDGNAREFRAGKSRAELVGDNECAGRIGREGCEICCCCRLWCIDYCARDEVMMMVVVIVGGGELSFSVGRSRRLFSASG